MTEISLFPLDAVLLPTGRIRIQLFEQRYLELVKRCLREAAGFGVVQIIDGSKVYRAGRWRVPKLAAVGCYARIVDWDGLPGGHLGVTLEGERRIAIGAVSVRPNHLLTADCDEPAPEVSVAMPPKFAELVAVLKQLVRHPTIERLRLELDTADAVRTGMQLTQLLPLANPQRQQLLELSDPLTRLERIGEYLADLGA